MRVVQLLPSITIGDAVSNDARALKQVIASMGFKTQIYAEGVDRRLPKDTALPLTKMPPLKESDILIYHLAIGTDLNRKIDSYKCRKMMIYHNITPPAFFAPYNRNSEQICASGLKDMARLNQSFTYCMADSPFNRQNLLDAGYTCPIDVRPVLIPFDDYKRTPDAATVEQYSDGWTNILFVGRIAPNKKQEDVIRAFAYYKKHINPQSRLILVGNAGGMENYLKRLQDYINVLDVQDVIFPGHISFEQILAFYRTAHVFLCMSEHEGFCVPLLEAMFFNVPVIAYDSCAVPDTLGNGMLLESKDPRATAAVIDRLVQDKELREKLLSAQKKQLESFSYEHVSELFKKQFTTFLNQKAGCEE